MSLVGLCQKCFKSGVVIDLNKKNGAFICNECKGLLWWQRENMTAAHVEKKQKKWVRILTDLINNEKINLGFDIIDNAMAEVVNEHKLNFYEILTILAMMDSKIKQNNISQYLIETVTRFQEQTNKEDQELRW